MHGHPASDETQSAFDPQVSSVRVVNRLLIRRKVPSLPQEVFVAFMLYTEREVEATASARLSRLSSKRLIAVPYQPRYFYFSQPENQFMFSLKRDIEAAAQRGLQMTNEISARRPLPNPKPSAI
jgi:hypothetical protein